MAVNKTNAKRSEILKAKRGMGRKMWAATRQLKRSTVKQAKCVRRKRVGQAPRARRIMSREAR